MTIYGITSPILHGTGWKLVTIVILNRFINFVWPEVLHLSCYFKPHFLKLPNKAIPLLPVDGSGSKLVRGQPDTIPVQPTTWISQIHWVLQEKLQDQWILMGHQCHQKSIAPPAPQPLDQILCFLCIPYSMTLFYNARYIFLGNIFSPSQKGRKRPQKRKDLGLVCIWGTSTHGRGVTKLGTL